MRKDDIIFALKAFALLVVVFIMATISAFVHCSGLQNILLKKIQAEQSVVQESVSEMPELPESGAYEDVETKYVLVEPVQESSEECVKATDAAEPTTLPAPEPVNAVPAQVLEEPEKVQFPESAMAKLEMYDAALRSVETPEEQRYREMSERLAAGEIVETLGRDDANHLTAYYTDRYAIANLNDITFRQFCGNGYTYGISVDNPDSQSKRAACVEQILKTFPDYSGLEGDALLKAVCTDVHNYFRFDRGCICLDTVDALQAKKGVCVHYSACVSVLATMYGTPCRTVGGKRRPGIKSFHSWNMTYYSGGKYWDALMVSNGNLGANEYIEDKVFDPF